MNRPSRMTIPRFLSYYFSWKLVSMDDFILPDELDETLADDREIEHVRNYGVNTAETELHQDSEAEVPAHFFDKLDKLIDLYKAKRERITELDQLAKQVW
ncbi:hypothetical protein AB6A40_009329 [Gnathostoma spinigerum]|uniref:Uncharacterized protein n=1 Tax=Gnathostoma spinigerum TaxID=75299 RepID=A0ABD6F1E9_9BILA